LQENSQSKLREEAGRLLSAGEVELVVGYGEGHGGAGVRPLLITAPEDAQKLVWNEACVHNLATYLSREPCRQIMLRGGRVGLVAKGCDARAVVVLATEGQIVRDRVHVIGMVCDGVSEAGADEGAAGAAGGPLAKCRQCGVRTPPVYDTLIGDPAGSGELEGDPLEEVRRMASMPREERWKFWTDHLSRCIKCYACRQACPMCYCAECITEKSQPQWIDRGSHLRGALAYHLTRAMHLAGRCVGCGECGRACPMDIPVDRISRYLAAEVEDAFDYTAGMDPEATPAFRTYRRDDPGDFIR
jgi:formate dehydrogenase subunit beta